MVPVVLVISMTVYGGLSSIASAQKPSKYYGLPDELNSLIHMCITIHMSAAFYTNS